MCKLCLKFIWHIHSLTHSHHKNRQKAAKLAQVFEEINYQLAQTNSMATEIGTELCFISECAHMTQFRNQLFIFGKRYAGAGFFLH